MPSLTRQRCFNHAGREAAARCLGCGHFFCRECVTEHDDRSICAACLLKLANPEQKSRRRFARALRLVQCGFSFLLLWFFFYLAGEALLAIPSSFHEGTLWRVPWIDR